MSKFATLGQGFNLLAVLANNTGWESLNGDLLQRLIDKPSETGLQFAAFLRNGARMSVTDITAAPFPTVFTAPTILVIDYSLTLEDMIVAGRYDWVNNDITATRFPVKGEGTAEYEAKLFDFDRSISSEAAVRKIRAADRANPWEPARIEHLLAFGAKHPDEECRYPIVALGSVCVIRSDCYIPCVEGVDAGRFLLLSTWTRER